MTKKHPRNLRRRTAVRWLAFLAPVAAVVALIIAANVGGTVEPQTDDPASGFALPDTAGGTVDLNDILDERDALLYFSMGVGCDACFLQIPEIAAELDARDIEFVPIMGGDPHWIAAEAGRLKVATPIVVDADLSVSEAYGMLGHYGHSDMPNHSFALVRRDGEITWVHHYAEMFVPADRFFSDLPA